MKLVENYAARPLEELPLLFQRILQNTIGCAGKRRQRTPELEHDLLIQVLAGFTVARVDATDMTKSPIILAYERKEPLFVFCWHRRPQSRGSIQIGRRSRGFLTASGNASHRFRVSSHRSSVISREPLRPARQQAARQPARDAVTKRSGEGEPEDPGSDDWPPTPDDWLARALAGRDSRRAEPASGVWRLPWLR